MRVGEVAVEGQLGVHIFIDRRPALGDHGGAFWPRLAVLPGEELEAEAVLGGLGAQLEPEPLAGLLLDRIR